MKSCLHILFFGLAMSLSCDHAWSDAIAARHYTSNKLDVLWNGTLGSRPPEAIRFAMLAPATTSPAPVSDVPAGDFGLPFTGDVIGESATSGGTASIHKFPVIPMSADDASVLNRRLAWSEIYLSRYRYFETASTDSAAVLQALERRSNAALIEAYLIYARLYFAAPDLQQKCAHLKRMSELAKASSVGSVDLIVPDDWRALLPVATATKSRMGSDTLAKLACSVEPVRGRAETKKIVETRVREKILQKVRAKVSDTLTLLNETSTKFQTIVNDMNVTISSAEIMELERVLGNASANMVLVKEDQLKAAETIANVKAVDLSSLTQPTALQEFESGKARMLAMIALIDGVMEAMADLAKLSNDPTVAAELAPCSNLRGAYAALDLSKSTDVLVRDIDQPYQDCIARALSVVQRFQKPSLLKAQMAEFANRTRQISEIYLTTVSP
jgi:hypothetical protein